MTAPHSNVININLPRKSNRQLAIEKYTLKLMIQPYEMRQFLQICEVLNAFTWRGSLVNLWGLKDE